MQSPCNAEPGREEPGRNQKLPQGISWGAYGESPCFALILVSVASEGSRGILRCYGYLGAFVLKNRYRSRGEQ